MTDWGFKWRLQKDKKLKRKIIKDWEGYNQPSKVNVGRGKAQSVKEAETGISLTSISKIESAQVVNQIIEMIGKSKLLKKREKKVLNRFYLYLCKGMKVKDADKLISRYFMISRENVRVIRHRAWKKIKDRFARYFAEINSEVD